MQQLIDVIANFSKRPPRESEQYERWIEQNDFVQFLSEFDALNEVILYASGSHIFLHGVLVPSILVSPPDKEDLEGWNHNPFSSWGISVSGGEEPDAYISPPLDYSGSRTLMHGEQVVFARDFKGRTEDRDYIECSQRLTHSFGLHYVPERNAYSRFDDRGDIEDVIRIVETPDEDRTAGRVVSISRDVLDEYMDITGQSFVLMYESYRYTPSHSMDTTNDMEAQHELSGDIFYNARVNPGSASFLRGIAIVRSRMSLADVVRRHEFSASDDRQYESFVAYDFKHNRVCECSTNPNELGNYFVKSDLPFETSPVFFNADVLHKYKADTEKYRIQDRSITCRNAWHIQSYDVNEEGQIHTYLKYLSYLPHDEQLYWKAFNEEPRATISKRAFTTDFLGEFNLEYDPLPELKARLHTLDEKRVGWWAPRDRDLYDLVHYPISISVDEWIRELHMLDKLLVEGFVVKELRKIAGKYEIKVDKGWGSLKLIDEVVKAIDCDEETRAGIVTPLREIHLYRNKLSGHAGGKEAQAIKASCLKNHKSYPAHFRDLAGRCDHAVAELYELLEDS